MIFIFNSESFSCCWGDDSYPWRQAIYSVVKALEFNPVDHFRFILINKSEYLLSLLNGNLSTDFTYNSIECLKINFLFFGKWIEKFFEILWTSLDQLIQFGKKAFNSSLSFFRNDFAMFFFRIHFFKHRNLFNLRVKSNTILLKNRFDFLNWNTFRIVSVCFFKNVPRFSFSNWRLQFL